MNSVRSDDPQRANTKKFRSIVAASGFGGFLFGYDTAIINGAQFQLRDHFHFGLDSWENALIVSIAVAGAAVGSLCSGHVGTVFGRRRAVLVADIFFIVGSVVLCAANALWMVYTGRLLLGFGIGMASVIVPVYLAEVSPPQLRGSVISINNFFLTGAQFIAACIAAAFVVPNVTNGWRYMFAIGAVPAMTQLFLVLYFLPESPRWLYAVGRVNEAEDISAAYGLQTGHENDGSSAVVNSSNTALLTGTVEFSYWRLWRDPDMRWRLYLGVSLQLFQQLSGINTLMYYSGTLLKNVGYKSDNDAVLWGIPLALTNAVFTMAGAYTVDRIGRRKLFSVSLSGCLAATAVMAVCGFIGSDASRKVLLASLFAYLAFFAPGIGIGPWIVNAELFPTELRSAAAAAATTGNWAANAAVSEAFPLLLGRLGVGWTFIIICAFILLSLVSIWLFLPETKGLELEEIAALQPRNPFKRCREALPEKDEVASP